MRMLLVALGLVGCHVQEYAETPPHVFVESKEPEAITPAQPNRELSGEEVVAQFRTYQQNQCEAIRPQLEANKRQFREALLKCKMINTAREQWGKEHCATAVGQARDRFYAAGGEIHYGPQKPEDITFCKGSMPAQCFPPGDLWMLVRQQQSVCDEADGHKTPSLDLR